MSAVRKKKRSSVGLLSYDDNDASGEGFSECSNMLFHFLFDLIRKQLFIGLLNVLH